MHRAEGLHLEATTSILMLSPLIVVHMADPSFRGCLYIGLTIPPIETTAFGRLAVTASGIQYFVGHNTVTASVPRPGNHASHHSHDDAA